MPPIFDSLVPESPPPGDSPYPGAPDFAAAKERIFGVRRKSPKRKSPDTEPETSPTEKDLEKIFAGENWEEVSALYFNARYAITGWDGFRLSEPQKKILGLSLGTTMKMLLKIDPGYIAMILFLTNFGGIVAQKEVLYRQLINEQEKKDSHGKVPS